MLGVGIYFEGRISEYDMGGELIKIIGKIPIVLKNNEELSAQHSHGFIGNFAYKEAQKEVYLATRHGTIIEKYGLGGALISTLHGPETYFPEYDIVPAGQYITMTYNKKTRFGYIDICYNKFKDKLFVLYSGRYQFGKNDRGPSYMGNIIYVLDNKDRIIEQIELDRDIFQMTISDDGSKIYGLSDKEILKYDYIEKS